MMLKTVASFALGKGITLKIARGSVLDFAAPSGGVGAIVNAANEGCLGGGGVDGAINDAGGPNLWKDREALPFLEGSQYLRCQTGDATITGPNEYGELHVPYVIHAVGPDYMHFRGMLMEGQENNEFAVPDSLVFSAYQRSLDRCKEHGITDVGFSLLSAGIFRGRQSMPNVLAVGIWGIMEWVKDEEDTGKLKTVTLCGFSEKEVHLLFKVSKKIIGEDVMEIPEEEEESKEESKSKKDEGKEGQTETESKSEEKPASKTDDDHKEDASMASETPDIAMDSTCNNEQEAKPSVATANAAVEEAKPPVEDDVAKSKAKSEIFSTVHEKDVSATQETTLIHSDDSPSMKAEEKNDDKVRKDEADTPADDSCATPKTM